MHGEPGYSDLVSLGVGSFTTMALPDWTKQCLVLGRGWLMREEQKCGAMLQLIARSWKRCLSLSCSRSSLPCPRGGQKVSAECRLELSSAGMTKWYRISQTTEAALMSESIGCWCPPCETLCPQIPVLILYLLLGDGSSVRHWCSKAHLSYKGAVRIASHVDGHAWSGEEKHTLWSCLVILSQIHSVCNYLFLQ